MAHGVGRREEGGGSCHIRRQDAMIRDMPLHSRLTSPQGHQNVHRLTTHGAVCQYASHMRSSILRFVQRGVLDRYCTSVDGPNIYLPSQSRYNPSRSRCMKQKPHRIHAYQYGHIPTCRTLPHPLTPSLSLSPSHQAKPDHITHVHLLDSTATTIYYLSIHPIRSAEGPGPTWASQTSSRLARAPFSMAGWWSRARCKGGGGKRLSDHR
jgi:hypothetical protein